MTARNPNYRLAKIHKNYTVDEIARLFTIHRNTVHNWLRDGLPKIDATRPILILGAALGAFLKDRRQRSKRPCGPDQLYCMRCRTPRKPVGARVEYRALTLTGGNLVGTCPACSVTMFRRTSVAALRVIQAELLVSLPEAQEHISESLTPSVNCDLKQEH